MARIPVDPNYSFPTFPRATAATDIFVKEDVQALAAAVSTHVHDGAGKGLLVGGPAAGSITNAQLGPDVARANLLTNGGFEVFQRGGAAVSTNGAYTADRWQINLIGTDTMSVSGDGANVDPPSSTAAAVTFTLGSGGGLSNLQQKIEGLQAVRTLSFSVRVRTSVANAVRIGIYDTTWHMGTAHPGGGTYQTLTVTWTPTQAPIYVGILFAASCTAYLDNAMLVVGSQAANYVPMHPADDLARCLRYYETIVPPGAGGWIGYGQCYAATNANFAWRYLVQKPVTPTITVTSPTSFSLQGAAGGGPATTALVAAVASTYTAGLTATVASGLVAGNSTLLSAINASAQISSEANP